MGPRIRVAGTSVSVAGSPMSVRKQIRRGRERKDQRTASPPRTHSTEMAFTMKQSLVAVPVAVQVSCNFTN